MNTHTKILVLLNLCTYTLFSQGIPKEQLESSWYKDASISVENKLQYIKTPHKAKNIILFLGDGMSMSTVTAARIYAGQLKGEDGEENFLSFEKFPFTGLSKTYNTNTQTPDSAGTMSAIMTGVKTKSGVLSLSEKSLRADCQSQKQHTMTTFLELAEEAGLSTGVVSTARITHATPAATYAHISERDWENNSQLSEEAQKNGCQDIALQLINFNHGNGIEVLMGGGRREFLPKGSPKIEGKTGKRTDGLNLINQWEKKNPQGKYVQNLKQFNALNKDTTKIFALFNPSHMHYEADRKKDIEGEPSLSQMTKKAIEVLSKNKKGYFLMVEAARIDQAHHAGSAFNALNETVELSRAVRVADALTNDEDTLIIVTADHSHVFTMAGYPKRGNPILGKVVGVDEHGRAKETVTLAKDGLPFTTLGYANGRGYMNLHNETNADVSYDNKVHTKRADLSKVDTTQSGFHQEAKIPLDDETHSGEDVGIYAKGPSAALVSGVNEENVIFHIMKKASGL